MSVMPILPLHPMRQQQQPAVDKLESSPVGIRAYGGEHRDQKENMIEQKHTDMAILSVC
jgi:hypothetical protein